MMLTNNQKELALKSIQKFLFAGATLKEGIEKGTLGEEYKNQLLSISESYLTDVQEQLNYDSHLREQEKSRYEGIRKANLRIQELEKQLASKNPLDGFQEQFELVHDAIRTWWKEEGFVYVEEVELANYGLKVRFGFQLSGRSSFFSQDPEGDRAERVRYKASLKEKGFEFADNETESFYKDDLYATPENKRLLIHLISKRFPSFECQDFSTFANPEFSVIQTVNGIIRNVIDVRTPE